MKLIKPDVRSFAVKNKIHNIFIANANRSIQFSTLIELKSDFAFHFTDVWCEID